MNGMPITTSGALGRETAEVETTCAKHASCPSTAILLRLGIPVWDGPGNRVNGGVMTYLVERTDRGRSARSTSSETWSRWSSWCPRHSGCSVDSAAGFRDLCSEVELLCGSKNEERLEGQHRIVIAVAPVDGLHV